MEYQNAKQSLINNSSLYNSQICRLCGEKNQKGSLLFTAKEEDVANLINMYLPLQISDDGVYPRWICPGCRLQVESTVEFFDLVIGGQQRLLNLSELKSSNMPLSDNLFDKNHDMVFKMNGEEKPKRKRGRPPKVANPPTPNVVENEMETTVESTIKVEEEEDEFKETEGRRKRRIKIPLRFQEVVQGKELEKIYVEKGVIDKVDAMYEDNSMPDTAVDYSDEIIGHLQDTDGLNIADLVFSKSNRKQRKTKLMCDICNRGFIQETKYFAHRATHHNVRFECTQCIEHFLQRSQLSEHQKLTGHVGEGIVESLEMMGSTDTTDKSTEIEVYNESETVGPINCENAFQEEMGNVLDDINNIEAAKVLYGLQNIVNNDDYSVANFTIDSFDKPTIKIVDSTDEFVPDRNCPLIPSDDFQNKSSDDFHEDKLITNEISIRHDCIGCNKSFTNASLLDIHYKTIHEQQEVQQLLDNQQIEESENVNTLQNCIYKCDKCNRSFKSVSSFQYHKESEHNSGRRFACSKCGKHFKHKQLLQRHQLVHTEDRPYSCETCGASFKTKPNLLNHLSKHQGVVKKYECKMCPQTFSRKSSLKLHYIRHSGTKPFKCDDCGKTFTQNGNLQEHIRTHTGERPYECEYCDKKFKTSSQCRIHTQRHMNIKPFECNICSKSFLQYELYRTHLRRHNNEKPFSCSFCSKNFSEKWALRKHTRIHTGERPYKCTICFKAFSDVSNLTKHKKTHDLQTMKLNNINNDNVNKSSAENNVVQTVWKLIDNSNCDIAPDDTGDIDDPCCANETNQIIYVSFPASNKSLQDFGHGDGAIDYDASNEMFTNSLEELNDTTSLNAKDCIEYLEEPIIEEDYNGDNSSLAEENKVLLRLETNDGFFNDTGGQTIELIYLNKE